MPASACPDVTLLRTSVTDDSSLTGERVSPVAVVDLLRSRAAQDLRAQITGCVPSFSRSAKDTLCPSGLPGSTAIVKVLLAKSGGDPATTPASSGLGPCWRRQPERTTSARCALGDLGDEIRGPGKS
ncbi:unnamed protein product, partial [Mesorhabditis spiculigera]